MAAFHSEALIVIFQYFQISLDAAGVAVANGQEEQADASSAERRMNERTNETNRDAAFNLFILSTFLFNVTVMSY